MSLAGDAWYWPYVVILLAGWLATDLWRYLGVLAAVRVSEDSAVFLWVKAVATALVAAVISRLVLFPEGSLAAIPTELRVAALGVGFVAFRLTGDNVFVGLLAAELVLIGMSLAMSG